MTRRPSSKRSMRHTLAALLGDRKAATAVEYGLILALVVLTIMASLVSLGGVTSGIWNNVSDKVRTATG